MMMSVLMGLSHPLLAEKKTDHEVGENAREIPVANAVAGGGLGAPHYYRQVAPGKSKELGFDVAVYGGTPAGVTAAIQAARMGKKTVLLA